MKQSRKVLFITSFLLAVGSSVSLNAEIVLKDTVKGVNEDKRGDQMRSVEDVYVAQDNNALGYFMLPGKNELDMDKFEKGTQVSICPFYYSTVLNRRLVGKEGLAYHGLPNTTDSEKALKKAWAEEFEHKMGALEKLNVAGLTKDWPTWVSASNLDREKILQSCSESYKHSQGVKSHELNMAAPAAAAASDSHEDAHHAE